MVELRDPALLAAELELELERYRREAALGRTPPAADELAGAFGRVAAMLREADERGQTVDLSDDIVRLIRRFRAAIAAVAGAPARA